MTDFIYDIETYPNCFSVGIECPDTGNYWAYEISDRVNQGPQFRQAIDSIAAAGGRLVGFNNVGFDYPVIHFIMTTPNATVLDIYNKAMSIINGDWSRRFDHIIWDSDAIVKQIDLFKIHHFDNVSRSTSLKQIEFAMRMQNIQDLPFPPGEVLTDAQKDVLIEYMAHDVKATRLFYNQTVKQIAFRDELSVKYNHSFTNYNDTKIGKQYFIMQLEKLLPGSCYHRINGRKEPRQTPRPEIRLGDAVFPYIKFRQPEFQRTCDWFRRQITKGTKVKKGEDGSAFSSPFRVVGTNPANNRQIYIFERPNYYYLQCIKKTVKVPTDQDPLIITLRHAVELLKSPSEKGLDSINCEVQGFKYVFGFGGIHGSVPSQTVCSDETYVLIDLDVASYYPNLAIANRVFPAHLGEAFCDIYKDLYEQRKATDKKSPINAMLKLALNGVYGDSNSRYSPFYDPLYTMKITINGQLLLCLLAENILTIGGVEVIQINTDGLTVRIARGLVPLLESVAASWERFTGLTLESVEYKRMFIRDVNNYIGEYTNGTLKRKGAYAHDRADQKELPWHKNHSALVVAKAVEAHLVRGEDLESFIRSHNDPFDFMCFAKVGKNDNLCLDDVEVQRRSRYYFSTTGGELVKYMPPLPKQLKLNSDAPYRRFAYPGTKGWSVKLCNEYQGPPQDIDFTWYISEAKKLVDPLKK